MGMKSDLTFGYYDKAKFKGDVHWNEILFKYMFGVRLDDVKFNGKSTGICSSRDCLITFDSGTSLMSMPAFATAALAQQGLPTSSNIVPCTSAAQFGDMTLVIGGKDYVLSTDEWMFPAQQVGLAQSENGLASMKFKKLGPLGPQIMAQVDVNSLQAPNKNVTESINAQIEADGIKKHHSSLAAGQMACASTIMTMDIAKSMFLVGDVFMRKYYTIFDRQNDRVGLAEAVTNDRIAALQTK